MDTQQDKSLWDNFVGLFDVFYGPTFEQKINAKADKLGDGPEHTLEFYKTYAPESSKTLTSRDLAHIENWMRKSENLKSEGLNVVCTEIPLNLFDKMCIDNWMYKSRKLRVDESLPLSLISQISTAWTNLIGVHYMNKLIAFERVEKTISRNKTTSPKK